MMQRAFFFILCSLTLFVFGQTNTNKKKPKIPAELSSFFIKEAENKKSSFINCMKTISTYPDAKTRATQTSIGINLFEEEAIISVSSGNNNKKITPYSPKKYFKTIVAGYYNKENPSIIKFKSSPVFIDSVITDARGRPIRLEGHYRFSQIFCRGAFIAYNVTEDHVPIYEYKYCDSTVKTGKVMMYPVNKPSGIKWVVLLSDITIETTTKKR